MPPQGCSPPPRDDVKGCVPYIEDDEVNQILTQSYLRFRLRLRPRLRPGLCLPLAGTGEAGVAGDIDIALASGFSAYPLGPASTQDILGTVDRFLAVATKVSRTATRPAHPRDPGVR
jgi:hypothetical protein